MLIVDWLSSSTQLGFDFLDLFDIFHRQPTFLICSMLFCDRLQLYGNYIFIFIIIIRLQTTLNNWFDLNLFVVYITVIVIINHSLADGY